MNEVYHYSIHRTLGRTLGVFEYVWNEPNNTEYPPEAEILAAGRCNLWRLVAWGRRVLGLYGAEDTYGGTSNNNMFVLESGYNILREGAGIIPVIKRKLRSMEDVWFDAPIVEPKILMLRPTASQLCAWPWERTEAASQVFHDLLYANQYHYAFLPEEYLIEGRDGLSPYSVLLLPFATNLPDELTDPILQWVRSGGTLIMLGPAGIFTPYGEADSRLISALLGDVHFERSGDLAWRITETVHPMTGSIVQSSYGEGHVVLAGDAADLKPGTVGAKKFVRRMEEAAPRWVWSEGSPVELVTRVNNGIVHLTVINADTQKSARSTLRIARPARLAIDRGIERGFAVPMRRMNDSAAVDVFLQPGEGTIISLELNN